MKRVIWLLGFALFLAAACGDGDENGVALPAIPRAEPTITGTEINYPAKGYRAEFPEGWTADPNAVRQGALTYDAFLAPEVIEGVQPNITVAREQLREETDLSTFVDSKLTTLWALARSDVTISDPIEVAGQEASVVDYAHLDSVSFDKREVIFLTDGLAWTISLTTPEGQRDLFLHLLDDFLASFELLEPGGS